MASTIGLASSTVYIFALVTIKSAGGSVEHELITATSARSMKFEMKYFDIGKLVIVNFLTLFTPIAIEII
ncbi:hypothetical protein MASR2M41_06390 [Flammeovirgaceae bacterium]